MRYSAIGDASIEAIIEQQDSTYHVILDRCVSLPSVEIVKRGRMVAILRRQSVSPTSTTPLDGFEIQKAPIMRPGA